jgi:glycosyltransferase involved in cell wall biosynthesis
LIFGPSEAPVAPPSPIPHPPFSINHRPFPIPSPPPLSIIVPVYNEAENILPLLREIRDKIATDHEVLIVYDFDEDTTVPAVRSAQPEYPSARLVRNAFGRGALQAILTGFKAAQGQVLCVSMADLSDDLSQVDEMVRLVLQEGYDLVAGSRYMKGGRQEGGPALKGFLSRMAGLTLHWFAGLPVHDATNNFRVYSRRLIESIEVESDGGFELALELTVKAHAQGFRMTEVPAIWKGRVAGESQFRIWKWLPKYLRWYRYAFRHVKREA